MSMLSFLSIRLMMAVFLASSTWGRSCERPGLIVLTFTNRRFANFLLFRLLLGAWFAVCPRASKAGSYFVSHESCLPGYLI